MRFRLATLVGGRPVTNHCCAATAQPTRGYQSEHHRRFLTSVAPRGSPIDSDPPYQIVSTRMPALAPSSLSARASRTPTSRYPMLPTYTKGSPGLASEYVFAVATMSWLWTRNLRV